MKNVRVIGNAPLLEERSALEGNALAETGGHCPHCGSEAAVKQFNKRIKGTGQFWSEQGVEAILPLRSLWTSQDERWDDYWKNRPAHVN